MKLSAMIIIGTLVTLSSSATFAEHRKSTGGSGGPTQSEQLQIKMDDFHRKGFITDESYKNHIKLQKSLEYMRTHGIFKNMKLIQQRGKVVR